MLSFADAVAHSLWGVDTVEFGQRNSLNHIETLAGSIFKVEVGLLAREAVEEFPRCVALIEEWAAILVLQIVPIFTDGDAPQVLC